MSNLPDSMTLTIPVPPRDTSPPSSDEALSPHSIIEADVREQLCRPRNKTVFLEHLANGSPHAVRPFGWTRKLRNVSLPQCNDSN